ncbi:MAG: hypothetical protein JW931_09220 [Methanomicrobiaceae archaeon]|nr:hypothetical protein [Methanomicrobiaceae archaeon]
MFTGIDIGGTNTDIAVIRNNNIETEKISNEKGISSAFSKIHSGGKIAFSTSQPLNRLMVRSAGEICIITIPGPGLRREGAVKGAVTIRGDVAEDIDPDEIKQIFGETSAEYLAIAGKFSTRNPVLEERVHEVALDYFCDDRIALSHFIGEIGFPSRIATTIINAQLKEVTLGIAEIIGSYIPEQDFFFMKSDGGLTSPDMIFKNPSELYSSSQAAVVLGAKYLTGIDDALVMDIGGTTTDFIPMKNGLPEKTMVDVGGGRTDIKGIRALSLPFGGDSIVEDGLLPFREGVSLAFGGKFRTFTDALNVCGYEIGNFRSSGVIDREISEIVLNSYLDEVSKAISVFSPNLIIGTGYLAPVLMPEISAITGIRISVPEHAESANAVGVAVSRVSLSMKVHYDSEKKKLSINGELRQPPGKLTDEELIEFCAAELRKTALGLGSPPEDCEDIEIQSFRAYDVVRERAGTGRIVDLCISILPGISAEAP